MTGNPLIDIADAVVLEMNAGVFSQEFVAERIYNPELELEQAETLHVGVMPGSVESSVSSRITTKQEFQIDVAVRKKFDTDDAAQINSMLALLQEIDVYFQFRKLIGYPDATWTKSKTKYPWVPEHLRSLRQYTGLLVLTYRVG
jgi:hypothetical protein